MPGDAFGSERPGDAEITTENPLGVTRLKVALGSPAVKVQLYNSR